jgi:hypothetical protein
VVVAPLPAIVPLAAPEAPLPPAAPDALPLIVAPADAPDATPEVTAPEEPTPLAAPEATVSPVLELPALAPDDVVPLPGVPLIPVVLEVPETEVLFPEPTGVVPVLGLLQAQSPMARRVRYPNQRIFRDLSDNFSIPDRGDGESHQRNRRLSR